MDKITIGIPRGLYYYTYGYFLKIYFENLGFEVCVSPKTNRVIFEKGIGIATDEMCSALKIFLGHVSYLQDKVDYIVLPRIDNYGSQFQTCTNFLALYDIIHNLFSVSLLNYNIDWQHHQLEYPGLIHIAEQFGISKRKAHLAYQDAKKAVKLKKQEEKRLNKAQMYARNVKVLLVAHPYIAHDAILGTPIVHYLQKQNIAVIFSDQMDKEKNEQAAYSYSNDLYWQVSKEAIGALALLEKEIDGVIFLSSFPCGLDSLVNELVMRKISIPKLNIVLDDGQSLTGIETRLESFIDILLERKKICPKI